MRCCPIELMKACHQYLFSNRHEFHDFIFRKHMQSLAYIVNSTITLALIKSISCHAVDILMNNLNIMDISCLLMHNFIPEKHEVDTHT